MYGVAEGKRRGDRAGVGGWGSLVTRVLPPYIFISGNGPTEQMGFFMSYIRMQCVTLCSRSHTQELFGGAEEKCPGEATATATEFFLILARAWGSPLCWLALLFQ